METTIKDIEDAIRKNLKKCSMTSIDVLDIDDIVQEALYRLIKYGYLDHEAVISIAVVTARNIYINEYKKNKKGAHKETIDSNDYFITDANDPYQIMNAQELKDLINQKTNDLSGMKGVALRLSMEGYSYNEISHKLDITLTNTATLLSRGRSGLKSFLF